MNDEKTDAEIEREIDEAKCKKKFWYLYDENHTLGYRVINTNDGVKLVPPTMDDEFKAKGSF